MAKKAKPKTLPFDDLNKAEKQFIEDTRNGTQTILSPADGSKPTIRPQLIRWLAENSQNREIVAAAGIRLNGAKITSDQQKELNLHNIDIAVPLWLDDCEIHGLKLRAHTKGVVLRRSILTGGVDAQRARVDDSWIMHDAKVQGCFNINSAKIEGQFSALGAEFINKDGKAINAQKIITNGWYLRGATENSKPCKITGLLDLTASTITHIDLDDTIINVQKGIAIRLDAAKIDSDFSVRPGFATNGAIILDRAVIPGRVRLSDANISCNLVENQPEIPDENWGAIETGLYWRNRQKAISAVGAKIDRLHLPEKTPKGIIDLSQAKIGTLIDFASGWFTPLIPGQEKCEQRECVEALDEGGTKRSYDLQHIVLDGTSYDHLDHPDGLPEPDGNKNSIWQSRVNWLKGQNANELTKRFNPQPWRQLARTLSAQGYEQDARHIAIQRRVAQRMSEPWWHYRRFVSVLLHRVADYGFSPLKTLVWCVGVILLCGFIFAWQSGIWGFGNTPFGFIETVAGDVINKTDGELVEGYNSDYPEFNPWLYSLDQFIPILDLGMDQFWRPNIRWLYILAVAEQIVGAFLVALAITGFTGMLTRDEVV